MTAADSDLAVAIRGALPPGARFARYRLERALGDGASGIVYLAECVAPSQNGADDGAPRVEPGQRVALKVIHRHLIRDRQVSRRFLREAKILGGLRGRHLVPLLDFGDDEDGYLFMALELVEGAPLDTLSKEGPLPVQRAVRIVQQICAALEVAHGAGIVHRDLKPGNVIVEQRDGEDHVRVLDFGMAKMLRGDATQSLTALTEQNMVFGTPEYMAPEQARGDDVDARCDVYAAGVILYELLTGAVPFDGPTAIGVMTAHLSQEPPPPSSRRSSDDITPALEAVVMHALAKRPVERYPSAAAMAEALEKALVRPRDVLSTAPPPSDEELGSRDTDHALAFAPTQRFKVRVESAAPPASETTGGGRTWLLVALGAALLGIALGVALSLAGS